MNIESALWKVESYNDGYAHIIQKASGVIRTVSRGKLPSADELACVSELRFNRILREAFHTVR
jgi:hypothetical protein